MARQIIILEVTPGSTASDQNVRFAFWFVSNSGRQQPAPGFISAFRGATQAEQASLQAGTVIEETGSAQYPVGFTTNQIQTDLQAKWTARSAQVSALPNPNLFYGAAWDGTSWAAAAVAPGQLNRFQFGFGSGPGTSNVQVIAGVAGQTTPIHRLVILSNATGTIQLKAANVSIGPAIPVIAGVPIVLPTSDDPWFTIPAGSAFNFATSAVGVTGVVMAWFRQC